MGKSKVYKQAEVKEYLDLVGQDDEEKASKWVIETQDQVSKKEKSVEADTLTKLASVKRRKFDYLKYMAQVAEERFKLIDWPPGFTWKIGIKDDDKLHLIFRYKRKFYGRGIKCTGMEVYDLNAINVIAVQAENTVDQIMHPIKTESGIYLK